MESRKLYQMTIGPCESIHKKAVVFRANPREDGHGEQFTASKMCEGNLNKEKHITYLSKVELAEP